MTIAHYLSFKDIDKDEAMAILHTCIHGIHASESRAGTHEQIPNIMEVDRIHIQMNSLDLIHIMCGDVRNIPNEKFTSTTLWMLDTLNSYIQCQKVDRIFIMLYTAHDKYPLTLKVDQHIHTLTLFGRSTSAP